MTEPSEVPQRRPLAEDSAAPPEPDQASVARFLFYTLSLPERAVRTTVGLVGGMARETTSLLVPQAFQDSKTYRVMIRQTLDFLVEDIGGVERQASAEDAPKVENFVARKAVGNFVEFAGLLTFHISPLTVLAVVSDVAYGSTAYLRELSAELKKQGVIDETSTIENVDDLLEAVGTASGTTAGVFDTPPLSVEGLKETIAKTREAVGSINPASIIPQSEIKKMWNEMHEIAAREDVGILTVSGTMTMHALKKVGAVGRGALSSVQVAGRMLDHHIFDHYADALSDIAEKGIYRTISETSEPYIDAVWNNFSTGKETVTEDVVSGRLLGRCWRACTGWFRRKKEVAPPEPQAEPATTEPPSDGAQGDDPDGIRPPA